jgi:hypothetical protein
MTGFSDDDPFSILEEENLCLKLENAYYEQKVEKMEERIEEKETEHIFLGKQIYTRPDGVKLYASSTKKLFTNIRAWQYNRPLDSEHVGKLRIIILDKECLEGTLDILECNGDLCVVNGQHRVEAVQMIMKEDETFDREVLCNVHPVPSFESDEANEIFLATNNIKNVEMRDKPQTKFQNICNRLKDRYPGAITNNKTGKANLHRLDKKQIYNLMQYNDYFNDETNSEDTLFTKVVELNTELSNRSYESLLGRRGVKKDKRYNGACNDNFYLGLPRANQLAVLFQTKFN